MKNHNDSRLLKSLNLGITNIEDIELIHKTTAKILQCKNAIENEVNIGDILQDDDNYEALKELFKSEYHSGIELILKTSLENNHMYSFNIDNEIDGEKKLEYFYRSVGGWKDFNITISLYNPKDTEIIRVINPRRRQHWHNLLSITAGTVITLFLAPIRANANQRDINLACERYKAIFDYIQNSTEDWSKSINGRFSKSKQSTNNEKKKDVKPRAQRTVVEIEDYSNNLVKSINFIISKIDTFIHAGNARLIVNHIREYKGIVKMFVLRGEKTPVRLDADTIWAKEIRNGETVVYDFYGKEVPSDSFLKELIIATNKYTQQDKLVG